MITDLPVGTVIRYRFSGGCEYSVVIANDKEDPGCPKLIQTTDVMRIPDGTVVHNVIWKGNLCESRGTFVMSQRLRDRDRDSAERWDV